MEQTHAAATIARKGTTALLASTTALVMCAVAPEGVAGSDGQKKAPVPFAETRLIIEFNATDEDIGVQFFLDADGWKKVSIFTPRGKQIFESEASGRLLKQGGGTELFVESEEPTLDELPIEEFFALFPEGTYQFRGRTADGEKLVGEAEFSHDIPAGPEIVSPVVPEDGCAENVALPVTLAWNAVTRSIEDEPIDVEEYEIIVGEDRFDVHMSGTQVTVPLGLLEEGTSYEFEILAIADSGNQTITEGCFVTAD